MAKKFVPNPSLQSRVNQSTQGPAGGVTPKLKGSDAPAKPDTPSNVVSPAQGPPPQQFQVGNTKVTRGEYAAIKEGLGFGQQQGANLTDRAKEIIAANKAQEEGIITPEQRAALANGVPPSSDKTLSDKLLTQAAGAAGAIGGAVAGAGTGAAIGAAAGTIVPGPGNVIGAVAGGVLGGIAGYFGGISLDARQDVKEANTNFKNAKTGLALAEALANEGRTNEAQEMWNVNKRNLLTSQVQLKQKTKGAVGRKLSDGMDEYATVTDYIDNRLPAQETSFLIALNNPNPAKAQQAVAALNSQGAFEAQ